MINGLKLFGFSRIVFYRIFFDRVFKMRKNIIFACVIFTTFAQAVELSDFKPLFREARIKKEIPQEIKSKKDFAKTDSKAFYDAPQIKILQLIKAYQKEHFRFNTTLENIAQKEIQNLSQHAQEIQSQEIQPQEIQKLINDFIISYQKAQRIWLFNILANLYDDEFFANEMYENQTKSKKYEQVATLVNEFFGEQERFILSGGDKILGIILYQSIYSNEVCMDVSCGHPTEGFLLHNTYNALKTSKNQARLKEIVDVGFQGYERYILLKSIKSDEIFNAFKKLNYEDLILTHPSKKQFDDLLAEFDIDTNNAMLESFIQHFARWYLGELYLAKYALALVAKNASANEIVNRVFSDGFCQISKYLDQKFCLEKIDINQEWIYINDKQVCAIIWQDTIIKSPTNHTPLCKAIQKEVQKQFQKNQIKQDSSD